MKVLNRTKRLLVSNWEEIFKNFKNPAVDMEKALRTIDDVIFELRQATATRISDMKLLERHIKTLQEGTEEWGRNARKAVGAGQDDLARRALLRKKKISIEIEEKNKEFKIIGGEVMSLKKETSKTEQQFREFYNQSKLMQYNAAFAKTGLQKVQSKVGDVYNLEAKFTQFEIESEQKIHFKKQENKLEDELADLKNKVAQKNKSNKE